MAEREERTIGQLPALEELNDEALIPTEQSGIAYKMTGAQIKGFAQASAATEANRATSAADRADQTAAQMEQAIVNPPYIGTNGNWYIYSTASSRFVDSGYSAYGQAPTISSTPISGGNAVTFTGGNSETINVMDGDSPTVTVTNISGGHRVTIVDASHPSGQTFDVMDGAGSGDMKAATYDSDSAVANAGGIKAYVNKTNVGLGNVDNVQQYSASNPPPYPVTSVNGQTGAVTVETSAAKTTTVRLVGGAAWSRNTWVEDIPDMGLTANSTVFFDIDMSSTNASDRAHALESWAVLSKSREPTIGTDSITFYQDEMLPYTINVKVAIIG